MPRNQKIQRDKRFNTMEYAFEHANHADHHNHSDNLKGMNMKNSGTDSSSTTSLVTSIAVIAGVAVGGYFLWRNRSKISSFLASSGIADRFTAVTDKVSSLVTRSGSSTLSSTGSPQRSLERKAS